jgi:hypothetical protein
MEPLSGRGLQIKLCSWKIFAVVGATFAPAIANAQCLIAGASARLSNFCILEQMSQSLVDYRLALLIDTRLKSEGYSRGLGLPNSQASPTISTKAFVQPILSYSDNINGGNSPEPLVLGNLTFDGDETLYRKEGIIAGFGAGVSGRYIHAEGKYLTYGVNASYAHSPKYGLGIATTSANVSSINHIKNWWFLDAHINTSRVRKDITDETNSNISLVSSKVYASSENTYIEASFGVNRYFAESYNQNQLLLGYKTIHSNGVYSALNFTFGESIANQLATKFALSGQVTTQVAQKPLKLSASYSQADGGMLLGVELDESTVAVSASYPVWKNLTASVGYRRTDSSIDYFDVSTPTFGIQFQAIQF